MRYGLIGEKLGHSHSPAIHRAFGVTDYELRPVPRDGLDGFMRSRDFSGLNVTIPYKREVMPYCDELDPHARAIGCVNTLVVGKDGALRGYNTDFAGFELMAENAGVSLSGKNVLILGTGGASLTARAVAREHGAASVSIVSRTGELNYENVCDRCENAEVIINATPVGMYPDCGVSPVDPGRFPKLRGVLDVIYNPRRTELLLRAEALGLPHGDGLLMLVEQARLADELFTSRTIPVSETFRVCAELSRNLTNIVLIGMPGSGKTTIGRVLAERLGRELADTDELIEARAGMSVADIFAKFGEARFRELERDIVRELGARTGLIIATGGGVPVDERNHAPLRQSGRIYRINRRPEELATGGRPLSVSLDALYEMKARREPAYSALCDLSVENERTAEDAAEIILEDFLRQ